MYLVADAFPVAVLPVRDVVAVEVAEAGRPVLEDELTYGLDHDF